MIRTQISLGENEYRAAKREARRLGIPLAEFLRRALRQMLPPDPDKPWMLYAGIVASGDPHASRDIDDVVYGRER
ncbi:MAG: ribbon-helix-helix domain-containing protein [Nitrococcus sp.]|nr:ribbon-helix-helix domain-containing protein [Nitrococcus sp.]